MQWSFGIEHQIGNNGSVRAQYVGTRAVNQPYSDAGERIPNGVPGLLCAVPLRPAARSEIRRGDSVLHGSQQPLQRATIDRHETPAHGFQGQINYTWSHCLDTVSNGGFLPFSAGGILSPLPGELARDYGNCDYDIRAQPDRAIRVSVAVQGAARTLGYSAEWLAGFRQRLLAQRSAVLGAEHALFRKRKRHRARQRAAICQRRAGVSALSPLHHSGSHAARHDPMAQSRMLSSPLWTPRLEPAPAATRRKLPVRQPRAATPCAGPTSSGAIFT